jgi:SAM-dependent methyltransferase
MIRNFLPYFIFRRLFGDRRKYQNKFSENDSDWLIWSKFWEEFYETTQQSGVGAVVNNWGYKVLLDVDLSGKTVMEIGPGNLPHIKYWKNLPDKYIAIDTSERHFEHLDKKLDKKIIVKKYLSKPNEIVSIPEDNIDVIMSFFSIEHIHNLEEILKFFYSKLNENGLLVVSFPNEGGIAWGMGRYLTTRRFVHKNTQINYDKIICFEHPNYIDNIISSIKASNFKIISRKSYPLGNLMPLDLNLVTSLIIKKRSDIT